MVASVVCVFFFNDTATTEIYTLSLHDALPIFDIGLDQLLREDVAAEQELVIVFETLEGFVERRRHRRHRLHLLGREVVRSEEHTSELQSRQYLVCRLLLEKKKHSAIMSLSILT